MPFCCCLCTVVVYLTDNASSIGPLTPSKNSLEFAFEGYDKVAAMARWCLDEQGGWTLV
jgi:hypothetical protein